MDSGADDGIVATDMQATGKDESESHAQEPNARAGTYPTMSDAGDLSLARSGIGGVDRDSEGEAAGSPPEAN